MSSLQNRAPRLNLSFPLEFRVDGDVIAGHCLNLSESGLLAVFNQIVELWTRGELFLQLGMHTCTVPARVARGDGNEVGMAFSFRSEAEREAIRVMLTFAERNTHLVGAPPF